MKRFAPMLLPLAMLGLAVYALHQDARPVRADGTLSSATPLSSLTGLHVKGVMLDFDGQSATAYYNFLDAAGASHGTGGTLTVAFPQPTPALLGQVRSAVEKTLLGYASGGINTASPVAVGTAAP